MTKLKVNRHLEKVTSKPVITNNILSRGLDKPFIAR